MQEQQEASQDVLGICPTSPGTRCRRQSTHPLHQRMPRWLACGVLETSRHIGKSALVVHQAYQTLTISSVSNPLRNPCQANVGVDKKPSNRPEINEEDFINGETMRASFAFCISACTISSLPKF